VDKIWPPSRCWDVFKRPPPGQGDPIIQQKLTCQSSISSWWHLHPNSISASEPPHVLKSPIQSHSWRSTHDIVPEFIGNNNQDFCLKSRRAIFLTLKMCNAPALRWAVMKRKRTFLHKIPTAPCPRSLQLQSISTLCSCNYKGLPSYLQSRYIDHFLHRKEDNRKRTNREGTIKKRKNRRKTKTSHQFYTLNLIPNTPRESL